MKDNIRRRSFLTQIFKSIAGMIYISAWLQGCKQDSEETEGAEVDQSRNVSACDDYSETAEAEIKKREGFGYVEESPMPDKHCKNCQLYLPPHEGESCGGCVLFKGPVFKEGYCTYWAPVI